MWIDTLSQCLTRLTAVAAALFFALMTTPVSAADNKPDSERREGGVAIKLPQSPPMMPIDIGYLREDVEKPRPASRLDIEPDNAGIAGAEMGVKDNNAGGRFMGHLYGLSVETANSPDEAVEALKKLYDSGHNYIVADASAPTLLKLSDWAKDKEILLFNIRAEDVSLRQENCRSNIMHVVPDRYMLADALGQYLVKMGWTDWLVVHGSTDADIAYRDAVKRAAKRFGGKIVDVREYIDVSGGRRDGVGPIPPAAPHKEANADKAAFATADYDVIVVADEGQLFGPLMPYRGGGKPRIVAGTTGLVATTWSRGHEKWGATQAQNNFERANKRLKLPIDHMAYVATRTIGEAVTRKPKNDFDTVSAFIQGPDLQLAPFKGIKQQFRPWDGQFRQPILIATEHVPVSVSPQRGFPHASHPEIEVDTLGIDEPESICKM
ncbi:MAG: ABC transporter substrate-binding protein [Methyloceanibacter sp.]|nr:ABC transporter substrate-binding protein [Methyloceanibacter sp.]